MTARLRELKFFLRLCETRGNELGSVPKMARHIRTKLRLVENEIEALEDSVTDLRAVLAEQRKSEGVQLRLLDPADEK